MSREDLIDELEKSHKTIRWQKSIISRYEYGSRVLKYPRVEDAYNLETDNNIPCTLEELEAAQAEIEARYVKIQIQLEEMRASYDAIDHAREKWQKSGIGFRSLIQYSKDIMRILDPDGRIIFESPSSMNLLGYPPGYTLGKSPLDFIHPDDKERVLHDLGEVYNRTNPGKPTEFRIRKADGDYLDVESVGVNLIGVPGVDGIVIMTRPITERKQAENRLRESEEKYRDMVETADEGIWLLDKENRIIFVNSRMARMLGYSPDEIMGRSPHEFIDAHYVNITKFNFNQRKKGLKGITDVKFRRHDGSEMWARVSSSPRFKDGVFDGVLEMLTDVTVDKRTGLKIAWLASFPELDPNPIVEMSQFGQISYSNPATDRLFPDLRTAGPGHPYLEEVETIYARLHKRGSVVASREVWVGSACYEQNFSFRAETDSLRIYGRDITERKRVEERLLLTQFAVDNFTDSAIWIKPDGQILYVNDATCQNLGYARDEILSMRIWYIDPYYNYEGFLDIWNELKRKGVLNFESTHVRKDGSSYPVEVSIKYLEFGGGEFMVTFDRDLTDRKQKEIELSDAKAQVDLYLDLIGHDINNINQIALGYLEMADNVIKSGDKLGEDNVELIEKPMASLINSSQLIDNVAKLRKLKVRELKLERVNICNVLTRVKDRYSHVTERDITINYIPPAECLVIANELIDEVFINLVGNSIKHSHQDKPLVIDILQTEVCEEGKIHFMISIEDNGPGIIDEVKKKLFARFSRGETMAKGKGLGLYLVKTLVENFNGKIWVEDRVPGDYTKGARFVVILPANDKSIGT